MDSYERRGGNLTVLIILLALVVLGIAIFMNSGFGPDGLQSHIDEYKAMLDSRAAGEGSPDAPLSGPVVIVDYDKSRIDDLFDRLPASLRAENHPEVGTVIVITRHSTGLPAAAGGAVAPVTTAKGSYTITAYLFDRDGKGIDVHSIRKESVITGAGAEGELRAKADPEMADWIIDRVGGG